MATVEPAGAVGSGVGVAVAVGDPVGVAVGLADGVPVVVGVGFTVGVGLAVGLPLGVGVGVTVGLADAVGVAVAVGVALGLGGGPVVKVTVVLPRVSSVPALLVVTANRVAAPVVALVSVVLAIPELLVRAVLLPDWAVPTALFGPVRVNVTVSPEIGLPWVSAIRALVVTTVLTCAAVTGALLVPTVLVSVVLSVRWSTAYSDNVLVVVNAGTVPLTVV